MERLDTQQLFEDGIFCEGLAGQGPAADGFFSVIGPNTVDIDGVRHDLEVPEVQLLQSLVKNEFAQLETSEEQGAFTFLQRYGLASYETGGDGPRARLRRRCAEDLRPHPIHDAPRQPGNRSVSELREEFMRDGYVVTDLTELGVESTLSDLDAIFYADPTILHECEGDLPKGRKRARVVMEYLPLRDDLKGTDHLRQHPKNSIVQKSGPNIEQRPTEYPTFNIRRYPQFCAYLGKVSRLMFQPDENGTMGINFFSTFAESHGGTGRPVEGLHQDLRPFIAMLCAAIDGEGGARTFLNPIGINGIYGSRATVAITLRRGELILVDDRRYAHNAKRLYDATGRHMVIITRNNDEEYPLLKDESAYHAYIGGGL